MKSLGKVFPELLLERIYYHRIKLENFDVIQRALESQEDQELDAEQVIKKPNHNWILHWEDEFETF